MQQVEGGFMIMGAGAGLFCDKGITRGFTGQASVIHFSRSHQEFVEYLESQDRARATIVAYSKDIEQLLGHVGEEFNKTHVHQIETEEIRSFLKSLEEEGYTKKSISRKINSIKTFFRFLKVRNYITEDPAAPITHPRFTIPPPRILSETEYRALRDAAREDTRTYAIIELLLQTGIRIGELSQIKLTDIEFFEDGSGRLKVGESRITRAREIPLNKAVVNAIQAYLKVRPESESECLFVTRTGKPLLVRNIRSTIDKYFQRVGIQDAKVNDLRHTWVAQHLKRGADIVTISKLAGHKRLATTEKYLEYVEIPADTRREELETL